jgi:hypothetical protein
LFLTELKKLCNKLQVVDSLAKLIPPRTSLHPRIIYAGTPGCSDHGCSDHESVSYHAGTSDLTYRFFPL